MSHPEHAGQLPNSEHVVLPGGQWADLKLSLTHGEALRIEAARLAADYDVKGESSLAVAMVQSALSAAPGEWRDEHYDSTINVIRYFLESYERANETALSAPGVRENMVKATQARDQAFAEVIVGAWSYPVPLVSESWEGLDGKAVRILQNRSFRIWGDWQKELGDRLKDGSPSEPPAASTE